MQEKSHSPPENKVNVDGDVRSSTVHAPPSSSRLDHLLAPASSEKSPGYQQQTTSGYDRQNSEATTGLPSFASYLSDLESFFRSST